MRILSWNVNGLRAIYKKGFVDWFMGESPDILCIQEMRAMEEQLPLELREINGYQAYFCSAQRKGYSGVAVYTKLKPEIVRYGFGIDKFDEEGRVLITDYKYFTLLNIYFPNGGASEERLRYKLDFYDALLDFLVELEDKQANIIICGDVNTAHKDIDLAEPEKHTKDSGFLPQERAWIDRLLSRGYLDTFRMFNREPGHYTWWNFQLKARQRNLGWRIDYFFVSSNLRDKIKSAYILSHVKGSDHCPVGIDLEKNMGNIN
jgi:exodeoxyribonuclease-3